MLATQRDVRHAAEREAVSIVLLVVWPCDATITAVAPERSVSGAPGVASTSYPATTASSWSAWATGEPPMIMIRAVSCWGSMKISSAPPLRHGLCSTIAPSIPSSGSWPCSTAWDQTEEQRLARLPSTRSE